MDTALLEEGLGLMVFGMGFVFVFLTVLVLSTMIMSKVVGRLAPPAPAEAARGQAPVAGAGESDELMVVIGAALHRYRQRHPR